jgi:hypothetical protein
MYARATDSIKLGTPEKNLLRFVKYKISKGAEIYFKNVCVVYI